MEGCFRHDCAAIFGCQMENLLPSGWSDLIVAAVPTTDFCTFASMFLKTGNTRSSAVSALDPTNVSTRIALRQHDGSVNTEANGSSHRAETG